LSCHLTLALQITLVANDNHGEIVLVFDSQNLLLEGGDFLKTLARSNRIDQQEALSSSHVLFTHSTVFFLACRVQDIKEGDLFIDDALLPI
jgi:hypothetical protein